VENHCNIENENCIISHTFLIKEILYR